MDFVSFVGLINVHLSVFFFLTTFFIIPRLLCFWGDAIT